MISGMFKDKLIEEKYLFALQAIGVAVGILLILVVKNYTQHIFIKEAPELTTEASKRDFCTMSMNQMIQKKLSQQLMDESLYSQVTANGYKAMLFNEDDKVSSVFSNDESCKVLVHTPDGIRSFDLILESNNDYKFFYQIKKIHENELYEKPSQDS